MASVAKCCKCIHLDVGCLLIGVITLVLSIWINLIPITYFIWLGREDTKAKNTDKMAILLFEFINLNSKDDLKSQEFLFISISVVLWSYVLCCIALGIGVLRKKPGLILLFAGYTAFVIIMGWLAFALLLVRGSILFAAAVLLVTLIYIYFDNIVIKYYEFLSEEFKQKQFQMFINSDREFLVSCLDTSTEDITSNGTEYYTITA